jgi:hypothetical protein
MNEQLVSTEFLFKTDLKFQSDLDNQSISDDFRQTFSAHRIPLSKNEDLEVTMIRENRRWLIADTEQGKNYSVSKTDNEINVYALEDAISTERLIVLELRRSVAREADLLTEKAQKMLEETNDTRLHNTQIHSLLGVANTTDNVTDVIRFLERQGSRHEEWQGYAGQLIPEIRRELLEKAKTIGQEVQVRVRDGHQRRGAAVESLTEQGGQGRIPEIHLLLVREFIQSFGMGYLYRKEKEDEQ